MINKIDEYFSKFMNQLVYVNLLESNDYQDVVMQEEADLQSRGIQSIPYFIIAGQQFDGVQDVSTFKTAIGAALGMKPGEFLNF